MSQSSPRPLIGVPVGVERKNPDRPPHHFAGEKYLRAVAEGAGAVPMLVPALGEALDFAEIVARIDGLVLTGGRANVEPHHYGGPPFPDDEIVDPARDATVLPLIRACIAGRVPVFGICRGLQEINVALGGSLHYRLHLLPGKMDHRMDRTVAPDARYGPRHSIALTPGGLLEGLAGARETTVNSLHGQGIDRLADGLVVEALAPDGVIEAVRLAGAKAFTVGVQWHAEWRLDENPLARALFAAFGQAARERALANKRRRQAA